MVLNRATTRALFVPMHYWGPILALIGVVLCVMEFIK
jgi:hypothetical protein